MWYRRWLSYQCQYYLNGCYQSRYPLTRILIFEVTRPLKRVGLRKKLKFVSPYLVRKNTKTQTLVNDHFSNSVLSVSCMCRHGLCSTSVHVCYPPSNCSSLLYMDEEGSKWTSFSDVSFPSSNVDHCPPPDTPNYRIVHSPL